MVKPTRRRVYLFMTRPNGGAGQILVFSHASPNLWCGVQTPGGTVEAGETPYEAALREAQEETGLTEFGSLRLLAEDDHENADERLRRYFFQLPVHEKTSSEWTHCVQGEGVDGGIDFRLYWVDLPGAGGLAEHFHAYKERIMV
jgi:8-oxo-dGTP pyrophosphatase MutT (NUDIX family)